MGFLFTTILNFIFLASKQVIPLAMIITTLVIMVQNNTSRMITFYKFQALLVAFVIILKAITLAQPWITCLAVLPLILFWLIRPWLAQATVIEKAENKNLSIEAKKNIEQKNESKNNVQKAQALYLLKLRQSLSWLSYYQDTEKKAMVIWLQESSGRGNLLSIIYSFSGIAISYYTAFNLIAPYDDPNNLAVVFSLVFLGLVIMFTNRFLFPQIIGLLVMEHGMFLGVFRVVRIPSLLPVFSVCLFLYTIITMLILLRLLPDIHIKSGSPEIEEQNILKAYDDPDTI